MIEDGWSRTDIEGWMLEVVDTDLEPWAAAPKKRHITSPKLSSSHLISRSSNLMATSERTKTPNSPLDETSAVQNDVSPLTDDRVFIAGSHSQVGTSSFGDLRDPRSTDSPVSRKDALKTLVNRWVFISARSTFRNVDTGEEMKVDAFNLAHQSLVPEVDVTVAGRPLKTPREVKASDYAVGYAALRVVNGTMYLPQMSSTDPIVEMDGIKYLNTYLQRSVPSPASGHERHWARAVCEEHLRLLLPDDWRLLLWWLAYCVQHPGLKIMWAPIIKGVQGDGKTTISKMLGAAMGARNVKVVSPESLSSDFTGYAEGACVAFLEEIRVKGHNRHDAMNKLKPLITNDVIEVVRKGENGRNVPNVTNYIAFTNYDDALVIDDDDRRWGVLFTQFTDRAHLLKTGLSAEYFARLHAAIDQHPDVVRAWFLSVDTSMFDPKAAPPLTAGKRAMIKRSISPDAAMVAEVIDLGCFGVSENVAATSCVNDGIRDNGGTTLPTSRMANALNEIGWRAADFQMKWRGQARRIYLNKSYDWPHDVNEVRVLARAMLDATSIQTTEW